MSKGEIPKQLEAWQNHLKQTTKDNPGKTRKEIMEIAKINFRKAQRIEKKERKSAIVSKPPRDTLTEILSEDVSEDSDIVRTRSEKPANKPEEKPSIRSEKPSIKPSIRSEKPSEREEKPSIRSEKPSIKPSIRSEKPSIRSEKPSIKTEGEEKPSIRSEASEIVKARDEKSSIKPSIKERQRSIRSQIRASAKEEQPENNSAEKLEDKPSNKLSEKPAEKLSEKPAEKLAEKLANADKKYVSEGKYIKREHHGVIRKFFLDYEYPSKAEIRDFCRDNKIKKGDFDQNLYALITDLLKKSANKEQQSAV